MYKEKLCDFLVYKNSIIMFKQIWELFYFTAFPKFFIESQINQGSKNNGASKIWC